jgi:ABC-type protease/lipase transport system fused ATPase/permease subunit
VALIAHRPSIIALADQVLVLRDGRADNYGPAGEILLTLGLAPVKKAIGSAQAGEISVVRSG